MAVSKIKIGEVVRDAWSTRDDIQSAKDELISKIEGTEDYIKTEIGNSDDAPDSPSLQGKLNSIKDDINNIDFSALAKESTLVEGLDDIKNNIDNIDLSEVAKESSLNEGFDRVIDKIDSIKVTEIKGDTIKLIR